MRWGKRKDRGGSDDRPSERAVSCPERTARLVRAIEAMLCGDSAPVGELFTPEVVGWSPTLRVSSREELAVELEDRESALTDVLIEAHPLEVAGECSCVEWVASATQAGAFNPSLPRVVLHGVTVAEFEGDRIQAFRHYWDEFELISAVADTDQ